MKKPDYEIQKRTLENGTDVILIRKPDYVQSFSCAVSGPEAFILMKRSATASCITAQAVPIFSNIRCFAIKGRM